MREAVVTLEGTRAGLITEFATNRAWSLAEPWACRSDCSAMTKETITPTATKATRLVAANRVNRCGGLEPIFSVRGGIGSPSWPPEPDVSGRHGGPGCLVRASEGACGWTRDGWPWPVPGSA